MDSGKHLFKALLGKKPESQLSQEDGQPSATPSRAVAWGQPSAQSSSQQVLQSQDWVCEPPESRRPSRRWSVSISEPRSAESTNAFHAFLVRSAPFWHNVTLEAQASRSPPS
nr:testis-expressed protein 22 [Vicugna pacos]